MTSTRKQKKTQAPTRAPAEEHGNAQARTAHDGEAHGLHMHTAHANLPIPYFTPGDLGANAKAATSKLPSLPGLPPPRQLAFYGGLGALAVAGLIEWPAAAAIGVATIVARSGRGEERRPQEQPAPAQAPRAQTPEPSAQTG